jgi:hypothetical protein
MFSVKAISWFIADSVAFGYYEVARRKVKAWALHCHSFDALYKVVQI